MIQKLLAVALAICATLLPASSSTSHAQFNQGRICNYSSTAIYVSVTPPGLTDDSFKTIELDSDSCTASVADAEIIWAMRCEDGEHNENGEHGECSNWSYKIGWGELRVCDSDRAGWLNAERRGFGAQGWARAEARDWYDEPSAIDYQLDIRTIWGPFSCGL